MIKKERYQCEYCGTWHDTEEDAKRCEKFHAKAVIVEHATYDFCASYPKRIGVRFDDGIYVIYGRQ